MYGPPFALGAGRVQRGTKCLGPDEDAVDEFSVLLENPFADQKLMTAAAVFAVVPGAQRPRGPT